MEDGWTTEHTMEHTMEHTTEHTTDQAPNRAIQRILNYLEVDGSYTLPYRFHTTEDGIKIPIEVVIWKNTLGCGLQEFGITVSSRGIVEHNMFNVRTSPVRVDGAFIEAQLERVKRILARPVRSLCGTFGPNKSEMMEAVGMDKKSLGIEPCCVCAKETYIKTNSCLHPICISCFSQVARCPLCRNSDISCECCNSDDENESDDDFANV
jgi:hypothetical protein